MLPKPRPIQPAFLMIVCYYVQNILSGCSSAQKRVSGEEGLDTERLFSFVLVTFMRWRGPIVCMPTRAKPVPRCTSQLASPSQFLVFAISFPGLNTVLSFQEYLAASTYNLRMVSEHSPMYESTSYETLGYPRPWPSSQKVPRLLYLMNS